MSITIYSDRLFKRSFQSRNQIRGKDMAADIENINLKKQRTAEISGRISQMLEDIRFGSIEIVVHDGKVVQIERREKLRPEVFGN